VRQKASRMVGVTTPVWFVNEHGAGPTRAIVHTNKILSDSQQSLTSSRVSATPLETSHASML
jgi:hypothetical protein